MTQFISGKAHNSMLEFNRHMDGSWGKPAQDWKDKFWKSFHSNRQCVWLFALDARPASGKVLVETFTGKTVWVSVDSKTRDPLWKFALVKQEYAEQRARQLEAWSPCRGSGWHRRAGEALRSLKYIVTGV